MHPNALLDLATGLLRTVLQLDKPADAVVSEFFRRHRALGPRERHALAETTYAVLRRRLQLPSLAQGGGGALERRLAILGWQGDAGPLLAALGPAERAWRGQVQAIDTATLPDKLRHNLPDWLAGALRATLGEDFWPLVQALDRPAPLDLRVNVLKARREAVVAALAAAGVEATPTRHSPWGLRVEGKPALSRLEPFTSGAVEVQDEGSQLAARAAGVEPGMQVADVCAGGGGKTLALAALMQGKGQIYAHDVDGRRLTPIYDRLKRAGVRNAQVRAPERGRDVLADLAGRMDVVFVDAPCSGSGTWRRAPDSKWRLRPRALETRKQEQAQALALAAPLVKPGGRLMYVTCSVLPDENDDAVDAFVRADGGFEMSASKGLPEAGRKTRHGVQLSPLQTGCDGFYVATLIKAR